MISSGAIRPARAPASIDMLETVSRPSMESARIASPAYSTTWPVAPSVPICPISPRIRSFAVTPRDGMPSKRTSICGRALVRQRLRGEHLLDLARPDAEGERAERAVRRGVRVAADDRHAGLRDAELGADHVHDPLPAMAAAVQADAEVLAVPVERLELLARHVIVDRPRQLPGRHVVVGRGEGAIGATHPPVREAEPLERLRARHLVHEVQVDEEQVVADQMVGQDLLVGGSGCHRASLRSGVRRGAGRR